MDGPADDRCGVRDWYCFRLVGEVHMVDSSSQSAAAAGRPAAALADAHENQ